MPSCHAIPKCMHIFHDDAHCRHPCDLPPSLSGHGTSGGEGFWGFRLLHGSFAQGGQGRAGRGRRGREKMGEISRVRCGLSRFCDAC